MEIRFVEPHYREQAKRLWMYCFGMSDEVAEDILNAIFNPEYCLGVFIEKELAAALYILPFEIFFHGDVVKMGGIAGVATLPEYRHAHCARNMLVKSLEIMKGRGQIFSMLAPFSYAFYRKYGWELCYHYKEYVLSMEDFKKFGKGYGTFYRLTHDELPDMEKTYNNYVKRYSGSIKRPGELWKRKLNQQDKSGERRYGFRDESGALKGYIFYRINNGKFHINELVYDSRETRNELFRFVYMHRAQAGEVVWRAPYDDNTLLMIDNPRREVKFVPGMMGRITDVKSVLERYPYKLGYSGLKPTSGFIIKVDDPWAPWNDGCFEVRINVKDVYVDKVQGVKWDIRCDIGVLTQIVLGYTSITQAYDMGRLEVMDGDIIKELDGLFVPRVTYMNDSF